LYSITPPIKITSSKRTRPYKSIFSLVILFSIICSLLTGCDGGTYKENEQCTEYCDNGYNEQGFDRDGFNREGFDRTGFNREGRDRLGFDRAGFGTDGFNRDNRDRDGYNREGIDRQGLKSLAKIPGNNFKTVDYPLCPAQGPITQAHVSATLIAADPAFRNNAAALRDEYARLGTSVGSQMRGLMESLRVTDLFNRSCAAYTINRQVNEVSNIVDAICNPSNFGNDADAANLYKTKIRAFQRAKYLEQREETDKDNMPIPILRDHLVMIENELFQMYEVLNIPRGSTELKQLETRLIEKMPASLGPARFNVLQQIGDFAKFLGWYNDLTVVNARGPTTFRRTMDGGPIMEGLSGGIMSRMGGTD
jgi:hypothetical protein